MNTRISSISSIKEIKATGLESSVNGHAVPRFSIYKPFTTDKVETLIYCFMKRLTLKKESLPATILAEDGFVYTAVYDSRFPPEQDSYRVVISFQKHTYGRFAVIRLVQD